MISISESSGIYKGLNGDTLKVSDRYHLGVLKDNTVKSGTCALTGHGNQATIGREIHNRAEYIYRLLKSFGTLEREKIETMS